MKKNKNMRQGRKSILLAAIALVFLASCSEVNDTDTTAAASESPGQTAKVSNYEEGARILNEAKDRFDYPKATEFLEKAVEEDSSHANAHFLLLYAYVKRSQYDKAQILMPKAEALRGGLSDKHGLWLDALAARINDDSEAEIAAWNKVTEKHGDDRWAWYELTSAYMAVEQYAEGAASAARALEIEPDPTKWSASWIYYLHSKALFRIGDYDAAITAAAPAESTPVVWRAVYFRQALARAKAGESQNVEAFVEEYKRISREDGNNNDQVIAINSALFYYEVGDYAKAVEQLQAARELGDMSFLFSNLGYNLVFMGETKQALKVLEEGMEKFPDNEHVIGAYGWALYNDGQLEAARDALIKARDLSPRYFYRIEKALAAVEAAIENPEILIPAYEPWLG